jgi:hypothetical protein
VLQRVREGGDETDIIRRLPGEVGISLRAGKTDDEEELQGSIIACLGPEVPVFGLDPPSWRIRRTGDRS